MALVLRTRCRRHIFYDAIRSAACSFGYLWRDPFALRPSLQIENTPKPGQFCGTRYEDPLARLSENCTQLIPRIMYTHDPPLTEDPSGMSSIIVLPVRPPHGLNSRDRIDPELRKAVTKVSAGTESALCMFPVECGGLQTKAKAPRFPRREQGPVKPKSKFAKWRELP